MFGSDDVTKDDQQEHDKMDPRARRTREQLGDALIALMHEKAFDSITVQDVLDRAGVARATFYAHFRDKNDLFLTENDAFFDHIANGLSEAKDPSDRVAPVRELFEHVAEAQRYRAALVESGRIHEIFELGRAHFARGIERRLGELDRARSLSPVQRAVAAHAHAGALIALLTWWLHEGGGVSAAALDEEFHRMVWSGVDGTR